VSPSEWHHYSGMVPGFLQGVYTEPELTIDLASLAARAGVRFVEAQAEGIDVPGRTVDAGGARLPFDILSLDVGARPAGLDVPGAHVLSAHNEPSGLTVHGIAADGTLGAEVAQRGGLDFGIYGHQVRVDPSNPVTWENRDAIEIAEYDELCAPHLAH